MAEIILSLRNREICRKPILHTEFKIGRALSADLVIDNAGVSHAHAAIRFDGERFVVTDTGSQNGITLNGQPVRESTLADGDIIGIHKFSVRFRASGGVPTDALRPAQPARRGPPRDVMQTIQFQTHRGALARHAADFSTRMRQERRRLGEAQPGWWVGALLGLGIGVLASVVYHLWFTGS